MWLNILGNILVTLYYPVNIIVYYIFGVMYPLFRSSRIARGKESEDDKIILLKFWVVHCIYSLITYYLRGYLEMLDIGDLTISVLHAVFVVFNFKFSEWVYDNIVREGFKRNQRFLHEAFKKIR